MPEEKPKKKYDYERVSETYEGKRYSARGKTKAEAYRKLNQKIDAVKSGDLGISTNMKVKTWAETWLETYMRPKVREPGEEKLRGTMNEATYKMKEQLVRNYIVPAIGNMKLREVTPAHLQKLVNDDKEQSFSHVSKLKIAIENIFRQAYIDRIISFDPSTALSLPAAKKGKKRSITEEERTYFFRAAAKNSHGLLFRFLAATGVRPNELAAIKVGDVDIDQKIVHVVSAVETGSKEVSTPKTQAGIRYTVFNTKADPQIVEDIRALIGKRDEDEFLFTKKDGGMLTRQALKIYWQSFSRTWDLEMGAEHNSKGHIYDPSDLKADGTPLYPDPNDPSQPRNGHKLSPEITTYSLRHTFGTDMQRSNIPIDVTSFMMGHADITTTAGIYVDKGKEDAAHAVEILSYEPNAAPKNNKESKITDISMGVETPQNASHA